MDRDFKGVWIPSEIWLNEDLGWTEKLLLVEIDSLAKNGECFASNDYFAKFFGLSKDRISKLITKLNRHGYVTVKMIYREGTNCIEKRLISLTTPLGESTDTPRQKHLDPLGESTDTPLGENAEDNNTSFNNTKIKTTNKRVSNKTITGEFLELWERYPRKEGKKKAFEKYATARKHGTTYEQVKNGLDNYIKYVNIHTKSEQYIKHGSTWFGNESWNDEYDLTSGVKKTNPYVERNGFLGMWLDEQEVKENILDYEEVRQYGQKRDHSNLGYITEFIPEPLQDV